MLTFKLLVRGAWHQHLRVSLTVIGLLVAICAFGLLRTVIEAWTAGAQSAAAPRLVIRNAISLTFPLPRNYAQRIRSVAGVQGVTWSTWFGGVYISERNFFPQFAVDASTYLDLYPELVIAANERRDFLADRQGVVIGRRLAQTYGWKIGDQIPLRGTIFPGTWTFTVRAIYDGATERTDEQQFLMHWDYLNETIKKRYGRGGDQVGVYIVGLANADEASNVAQAIDALFRDSLAETHSETENAFRLSFVAMTEVILAAIRIVSLVIILIILAVMANTIAMTVRERTAEFATLKALGFSPGFIARLIIGESMLVALAGGAIGIAITAPLARVFNHAIGTLFPVLIVSHTTLLLQTLASFAVGLAAAAVPAWKAGRVPIVDGLRHVG